MSILPRRALKVKEIFYPSGRHTPQRTALLGGSPRPTPAKAQRREPTMTE